MVSGSVACKKDDSTSSMPMSQIYPYTKKIYASIVCYNQLGKEERFGGLWQNTGLQQYMQIQLQCTLGADIFIKLYLDSRQNHSSIGMRQPGGDSLTNAAEKIENYKA